MKSVRYQSFFLISFILLFSLNTISFSAGELEPVSNAPKSAGLSMSRRGFCALALSVCLTTATGCSALPDFLTGNSFNSIVDPFALLFKIQWLAANLVTGIAPLEAVDKVILKEVLDDPNPDVAVSAEDLFVVKPQTAFKSFLSGVKSLPSELKTTLDQVQSATDLASADPLGLAKKSKALQNRFSFLPLNNSELLGPIAITKHAVNAVANAKSPSVNVPGPLSILSTVAEDKFLEGTLKGITSYFISKNGYVTFDGQKLQSPKTAAYYAQAITDLDNLEVRKLKQDYSSLLQITASTAEEQTFIRNGIAIVVNEGAVSQFDGLMDDWNFLQTDLKDPTNLRAPKMRDLVSLVGVYTETQVAMEVAAATKGVAQFQTNPDLAVAAGAYAGRFARVAAQRELLRVYRLLQTDPTLTPPKTPK